MSELIETLEQESTDLALHSKLCAQRYNQIIDKLDTVDERLDKIDAVLEEIKNSIARDEVGKYKTYLSWAGVVITSLLGLVIYFVKHTAQ